MISFCLFFVGYCICAEEYFQPSETWIEIRREMLPELFVTFRRMHYAIRHVQHLLSFFIYVVANIFVAFYRF